MRRARAPVVMACLLAGGPALADAASDALDACVKDEFAKGYDPARVEQACLGLLTRPCMDQPGGETTIGTMQCVAAEQEGWDVLLNAYWKSLRAYARALDEGGAEGAAEKSLAAQRAWLDYRQNECEFAAAEFTGGTFAGVTANYCMRDVTARRTIDIIGRVGLGR